MKNFLKKLEAWLPAMLGAVVLVAIAFFALTTLKNTESEKAMLLAELENARDDNSNLIKEVRDKQGVIDSFQGQLGNITSTVGDLKKLSETDPELLKKYSKVYFLNENYVPKSLVDIDSQYVSKGATNYMFLSEAYPYLKKMLDAAHADGVELMVASAYRSFQTQEALKSSYTVVYGSGANKFSADQGYSEHQLGTAADFTDAKLGPSFDSFASEPAYKWMEDNAWRYGFILSYPKNNAYYKFEPWHWRFVGIDLAKYLHEENMHFYDIDQRQIDSYLIKLFN